MNFQRLAFFAASGLAAVYVSFGIIKSLMRKRRLQKAIRKRKQQRNETIEQMRLRLDLADDNLVERRKWITSLNLTELTNELQTNNVGPVEVLEAYQWRAIKANDSTNCVCQFIAEADIWAAELEEEYRASNNKPPLYGVPISVKESFEVKGYDSTRGYAQAIGVISSSSSHLVQLLRRFGAVPFVRTNVPQSLLSYNCSNPIYGRTSHPSDVERTCGGSSGGEAALLAQKGSVLGIGSDVGGSIRTPAHFCGVTGLKPSQSRITQRGSKTSVPGRPMLSASAGPMARDVDGLATFMKLLLCADMFLENPYVAPVPFDDDLYSTRTTRLTIGYYDFDGFQPATPACQRAVRVAVEILQRAGHKMVKFDPPDASEAFRLFLGACTVDGGRYLVNMMRNDVVDPYYSYKIRIYSIPICVKRILRPFLRWISPDFGDVFHALSLNTSELREIYANMTNYREKFLAHWRHSNLDALICPPNASTAMSHELPEKTAGAVSYCSLFNVLDFPAGVVPVTRVDETDERKMEKEYEAIGFYSKLIKKDASTKTVGLPVGVQCAALPFHEEICLRVMKEIEDGLKNTANGEQRGDYYETFEFA